MCVVEGAQLPPIRVNSYFPTCMHRGSKVAQRLYSVRFEFEELWGTRSRDATYVDLFRILSRSGMNLQPEPPNITIDSSERVFDAPWEAHVFAITVRLHEQAQFDWTEWSRYLAEQIAQGSAESGPGNSAFVLRRLAESAGKRTFGQRLDQ